MNTGIKIVAALAAVAGGIALIASDNPGAKKFRDNLGNFAGTMAGAAARTAQGTDISYSHDTGWKMTPHVSSPASAPSTTDISISGNGIVPDNWNKMTYTQTSMYRDLVESKYKHELELKKLEVEKAKYEAMNRAEKHEEAKEEEKHEEA